ncbi:hypothetical protein ZWY2020_016775 [Hordeum vulgare]|nr:hypothetical protein ZWY2020_016775 [Hordeum vulgare]
MQRPARDAAVMAERQRELFLSQFRGRCFRCLSKRHRLADCRDPIHCIVCRRAGHIGRLCPQRSRAIARTGAVRARLGPAPLGQPLHARIRFPPPPPTLAADPMAQAMLLHVDPARRPRVSRLVTIPSPEVD